VTEPATAALVQGLLQLGRGMGLQVIAEGIEDLDQAAWLLDHGCAMAQGYAFGRPAPLPSPTEVLLGELIDAPAEIVAGELMPEPLPPFTMPARRGIDPTAAFHHDFATDETGEFVLRGELFDDLADDDE
jgi:EAL domain-containing protein (putative c-di-GMP-specific phosphodiesterase class I)